MLTYAHGGVFQVFIFAPMSFNSPSMPSLYHLSHSGTFLLACQTPLYLYQLETCTYPLYSIMMYSIHTL